MCVQRTQAVCVVRCVLPGRIFCFFFQAEDGIRGLVRSRGLGDVYKRQVYVYPQEGKPPVVTGYRVNNMVGVKVRNLDKLGGCLLYTSDAADDLICVDLGGRRIITKKKDQQIIGITARVVIPSLPDHACEISIHHLTHLSTPWL